MPGDERDAFEALVRRYGRPGPQTKELAEQLTDDGDCWSAAWRESRARGGRYVEGVCVIGNRRIRAHSWVEVDGPFGAVLVECTRGYENAHRYLGIAIDSSRGSKAARSTSRWPSDHRASVIEALVMLGFTQGEIAEMLATQ